MANNTSNPTIGKDYEKVVSSSENFLISLPYNVPSPIEVVPTATDAAPDVDLMGHSLQGNFQESINRDILGPGFIWVRSKNGNSSTIVVTVWDAT
jgi:hypothetical protein